MFISLTSRLAFTVIVLQLSIGLTAQPTKYEQKAIRYFFDSLFKKEYPNIKVIEFNGMTDSELTNFHFYDNCFQGQKEVGLRLIEKSFGKTFEPKIIELPGIKNVKVRKIRRGSKRFHMYVMQANEIDDKFYVMIEMSKRDSHADGYMFELNKNGDLLNWCKTGIMY